MKKYTILIRQYIPRQEFHYVKLELDNMPDFYTEEDAVDWYKNLYRKADIMVALDNSTRKRRQSRKVNELPNEIIVVPIYHI